MLENYSKTPEGVIYQIDPHPISYDLEYIKYYVDLNRKFGDEMSYLRLGNIIGSLSRVPTSILDVGYGDGSFLKVCNNIIPKCYGYDISPYDVPEGCERVEGITDNPYDVITFFDSLEHFEDIEFVKDLKCTAVCISLPDCHYKDDKWFEEWKHRKPDEHLWHFNHDSLEKFMVKMGFVLCSHSNLEDTIRKNPDQEEPNILTCIFRSLNRHESSNS